MRSSRGERSPQLLTVCTLLLSLVLIILWASWAPAHTVASQKISLLSKGVAPRLNEKSPKPLCYLHPTSISNSSLNRGMTWRYLDKLPHSTASIRLSNNASNMTLCWLHPSSSAQHESNYCAQLHLERSTTSKQFCQCITGYALDAEGRCIGRW